MNHFRFKAWKREERTCGIALAELGTGVGWVLHNAQLLGRTRGDFVRILFEMDLQDRLEWWPGCKMGSEARGLFELNQILDALIDQGDKTGAVYETLPPFLISAGAGLGGDDFCQRPALLLECGDFFADIHQDVSE